MTAEAPYRIAIIGAGPRGLSVYERLVALTSAEADAGLSADDGLSVNDGRAASSAGANASRTPGDPAAAPRPLEIHLVDPYPPGPGIVWRTDQDPDLLMNTTIGEQTVFPDPSCQVTPASTGPDMGTWYRERGGTADTSCTFGTRVLYGEYLAWSFEHIRSAAPAHVTTIHHPQRATAIVEPAGIDPAGAEARDRTQLVRLSDTTTIPADAVVLAVGHIPSELTDERAAFAQFARSGRLTYLPPGLPAEAPVERLAAGERVIFRGFGLNYFDLQTMLTVGRGGRFEPRDPAESGEASESGEVGEPGEGTSGSGTAPGGLVYVPSGREPILVPSSRRGVPYRSKPITPSHPLPDHRLRAFTAENVARLAAADEPLLFNDQLWPLILADLRHAWYSALARSAPQAFTADPGRLTEALAEGVDRHLSRRAAAEVRESDHRPGRLTSASPAWSAIEREVLADPSRALDLHELLRPLEGARFAARAGGPDSLTAWMLDFLRADLAAAHLGPRLSPEKALFAVLWAARAYLKELVAAGRIERRSFVAEVRGWFEDFVSGICDGPPPQRYAELIALTEAGLVEFVGPEVRITTSRAGEQAEFKAASPAVDAPVTAPALVDAASPANQVRYAADPLISGMLERGQLAVATHEDASGRVQPLSGIAVSGRSHRTVDAHGRVHPRRHCLSIQLSAVQLGLAIAANPGKRAQSLVDAHSIAADILAAARS